LSTKLVEMVMVSLRGVEPAVLLVGESVANAPSGSFSVTGTPVNFIEAVEATLCTDDGGERF
jgi:hypothetical protein